MILSREVARADSKSNVPRARLLNHYARAIIAQSKIPTLDYGIAGLNAKAPLPMRSLLTLIAPTGAGKTAFAMSTGAHHSNFDRVPAPSQGPTLHMLFELTEPQLAARRVSQRRGSSWRGVVEGELTEDEIVGALAGEHYYVVKVGRGESYLDVANRELDEVQRLCPGTPLLIGDYLQRIRGEGRDLRQATAAVVDDFVDLTESRDMYTMLVSKGSRGGSRQMRDGKTRGEAHVDTAAETSAIEAGSAVVLAITYENREGESSTEARIEIAKARFGATGAAVGMRFDGSSGSWTELTEMPLMKTERAARTNVITAAREKSEGFASANKLHEAVGGNRVEVLAAIKAELLAGGGLEKRDGRIYAREIAP